MSQGFRQSKYDECFYFQKIFGGSAKNKLLVTMHVDDCEVAGNPTDLGRFREALVKEFGEVKTQEWDFRHCGLEYTQTKDLQTCRRGPPGVSCRPTLGRPSVDQPSV